MSRTQTTFRNDINGLRAWAVVSVVLYHFNLPAFQGGFVGVDVFFVISGFLMTGIVVKGLERGNFSVIGFYLARARRIVPALLALCATLLALGWFVLLPADYRTLATHALSSLGFFSNIKYWSEAGYFDAASRDKWLLHTWSLSVEWQFYMLLPLALLLVWRIRPGRPALAVAMLAAGSLSLAASISLSGADPTAAFYGLHTRAWEMFCGGLVFLAAARLQWTPPQRRLAERTGLALVCFSVLAFDADSAWPGWRAALPVAGAMLVIAADRASVWTGSPVAQWLGDRSYALYLWHWPVSLALVYLQRQADAVAILAGLALTLALGHGSYHWLEVPSRRALDRIAAAPAAAWLLASAAAVMSVAVLLRSGGGMPGRFAVATELAAAESSNINPRRDACMPGTGTVAPDCLYGGKTWGLVVLGDSHADTLVTAVAAANKNPAMGVVQWTYRGCPPVPGLQPLPHKVKRLGGQAWQCAAFLDHSLSRIASLPAAVPVMLVGRYAAIAHGVNEDARAQDRPDWFVTRVHATTNPALLDEVADRIVESACALARQRIVYMVRPIPEMGFDVPQRLSRRLALGIDGDVRIGIDDYRRRNAWVWAAQDRARTLCHVRILDPTAVLCDQTHCYGSRNRHPLYADDNHLSESGNKALVPLFEPLFQSP